MQQTEAHRVATTKLILSNSAMRDSLVAAGDEGAQLIGDSMSTMAQANAVMIFGMLPEEIQCRLIAQNLEIDFEDNPHFGVADWLCEMMLRDGLDPACLALTFEQLATIAKRRMEGSSTDHALDEIAGIEPSLKATN